jgi:hypothetical protein
LDPAENSLRKLHDDLALERQNLNLGLYLELEELSAQQSA